MKYLQNFRIPWPLQSTRSVEVVSQYGHIVYILYKNDDSFLRKRLSWSWPKSRSHVSLQGVIVWYHRASLHRPTMLSLGWRFYMVAVAAVAAEGKLQFPNLDHPVWNQTLSSLQPVWWKGTWNPRANWYPAWVLYFYFIHSSHSWKFDKHKLNPGQFTSKPTALNICIKGATGMKWNWPS